jgi:hypothetical protein
LLLVLAVSVCAGCERRGEPSDKAPARAAAQAWLRTARFEDADPATTCRPDCAGQERGFDYARANKIEQPGDCDLARSKVNASEDFIEGCRAYGQYLEAAGQQ